MLTFFVGAEVLSRSGALYTLQTVWLASLCLGLAYLVFSRLAQRESKRPYSYPGDARPQERRLSREATFTRGAKRVVQQGWRPVAETQPQGNLLPHAISGQQVWKFDPSSQDAPSAKEDFDFEPSTNPNAADRLFRAARTLAWEGPTPDVATKPSTPLEAARKGFAFYQTIQCDDGQWAGDYGGPHFLLPGFVIASYITGGLYAVLPQHYWIAAEAYLRNHQQADGGWGSHLESPSNLFGSTLNYVALRLLGAPAEDPACIAARAFLHAHGGVLYAPPWAKFWLCVLGVYDYRGTVCVPPEMWLLPHWFPVHPGRFWCHCRMVYLPMCYLFAKRFQYDALGDPLTTALRSELYPLGMEYMKINWEKHMFSIADVDNYSPVFWGFVFLQRVLALYEQFGPWQCLRKQAVRFVVDYMQSEDIESNYLTIGPVSKAFHLLCSWVEAGGEIDPVAASKDKRYLAHVARLPAYLWLAEDGLKAQGYNGSMAWDTAFALQAVVECELQHDFGEMCSKAWGFLVREQVRALPAGDWLHWRQPIRGGWGFSTAEQAWPVSDTTAEAFKAVLSLRMDPCTEPTGAMPDEHLFDAVQFLLSYQNAEGGWATYENNRGWSWYELMNPAMSFGHIMIDYDYVECSSSAMQALVLFQSHFPKHRKDEIKRAVERGAKFIDRMQRDDGSWFGCWGSCFTYGCWFGVEGLRCAGRNPQSCSRIKKCCEFLLSRQNADGGWGEHFANCYDRVYSSRDKLYGCDSGSTVVQTAWALLALMAGECVESDAIRRGVELLMRRQLPSGDWAQENVSGVFNRSIGITYTAFRNVFPLWALGRYARRYDAKL